MRCALITALLFVGATPATATIFHVGTVNTTAFVVLGDMQNSLRLSPASTFGPGGAETRSTGTLSTEEAIVLAFHDVRAEWLSADRGTVFIRWQAFLASADAGIYTAVASGIDQADWTYNFTATGNGIFSGGFVSTGGFAWPGGGELFGAQQLYGGLDTPFGPYGVIQPDPQEIRGVFSIDLVAGQEYTMRFFTNINVQAPTGIDSQNQSRTFLDWAITYNDPVPEPASWGMMIAGFGLVGALARHRRRLRTARHLVR